MKINNLLAVSLISLTSLSAFSWGQKGHDTVTAIAERHMTPATLDSVTRLLGGKSIVYYANWLDNASHTPEYAYSKTWHYKNIDADKTYENAPNIKEGNIVQAIEEQTKVLQNPEATDAEKSLALKMVIHLLGDIHQPMHMGRATDLGGNRHYVKFFKSAANLHNVWDSKLPEAAHKWSYSEWVDQIDRATPQEEHDIVYGGSPYIWGKETYQIAKRVYDATPQDTNIAYDYIAEWTPTVEQQFLRGGLRLADVLNSVFDPAYKPLNGYIKK